MPDRRPSLMEPRIEGLLETTDAKFTLVTLAAGRPLISTVGLPWVIAPTQALPLTKSPTTEAGSPSINTFGTPGPVMISPVAVVSVNLAAGNGMVIVSP